MLRDRLEDFQVTEILGFTPDGEGEHDLVFIEKRDLTTDMAARRLADCAGVPPARVGYCGMKDRRAVTRQYFSIGMAGVDNVDWRQLDLPDISVLELHRHRRKLRRGAHKGNSFRLRLRRLTGSREALCERLQTVAAVGVPNYFGEQRFGRDRRNLSRVAAWMAGGRPPRDRTQRSMLLSAARSWLFNRLLGERVVQGTWGQILPGDTCMLAGSRSFFKAGHDDVELAGRHNRGDLHVGIPLWGTAPDADYPLPVELGCRDLAGWLCQRGLKLDYRAARLLPDDFQWEFCDDGDLELRFVLPAGGFATAVVRELIVEQESSDPVRVDRPNRADNGGVAGA